MTTTSASKIQETPPVIPTIIDHTPYCNIKKIACFAVAFFVISGVGVGLLIHFRLTQFLPACYAVGGLSFIFIAISTCKLCCEDKSKAWDPRRLTEATVEQETFDKDFAERALTAWIANKKYTPLKGIYNVVAKSVVFINDCNHNPHPLFDEDGLKKIEGNLKSLMTQFATLCSKISGNRNSVNEEIKKVLWEICVQEGKITEAGKALLATGTCPIFYFNPGEPLYTCKTSKSQNKVRINPQGPLAALLMQLRGILEKTFPDALT